MSNYHILRGLPDGNRFTVIFHVPIPNTDNTVGFNHRTAIAAQITAEWTSAVPHINAGELAQIEAGELYEYSWQYDTRPGDTLAAKRDELDAKFVSLSVAILARLEAQFEFYGFNRDVS